MAAAAERGDRDAPGEFLAEFLSAIMRRQYAEALKYCRLILQYEPHNATARGFFPLLQHKLQMHEAEVAAAAAAGVLGAVEVLGAAGVAGVAGAGHGGCSSAPAQRSAYQVRDEQQREDAMDQEEGGSTRSRSRSGSAGSCASQSSLELDSSDAPAHSSHSLSFSRRTDLTDSASGASGISGATGESGAWSGLDASSVSAGSRELAGSAGSVGSEGSGARWDSTGTEPHTEPDTDDNGNPPPSHSLQVPDDDVQNDNATSASVDSLRVPHFKNIFCQKLGLRR